MTTITRSVGLSDVRPNGRLRLDALARFLQDVADHDGHTAAIGGSGIWVLRRMSMRIAHTPRFRADVRLTTWCSGVGPRWAERRTDLTVGEGGVAEAVAIWVHVDAERGVPLPLPSGFDERWGATAGSRRVRATLRHPLPPADAAAFSWPLRAVDLDVVDHVNNAAYWAPVEEELARRGSRRSRAPRSSSAADSSVASRSSAASPTSKTDSAVGSASAMTYARARSYTSAHDVADARRSPSARVPDGEGRHDARQLPALAERARHRVQPDDEPRSDRRTTPRNSSTARSRVSARRASAGA